MSKTYGHNRRSRWLRTPMWWWREKTHQPARAKTRAKLHRLDEDDYPDNKKPQDYYW